MGVAQQKARLSALEGRTAQLPKRQGRTMPVDTRLGRLTAKAWGSYLEMVNGASHRSAPVKQEGTVPVQGGFKHQLLRSISFALTAGTNPEGLHDRLRIELHQIFGPKHPGVSTFGHESAGYQWHEEKHPDALALYVELCAEEHL